MHSQTYNSPMNFEYSDLISVVGLCMSAFAVHISLRGTIGNIHFVGSNVNNAFGLTGNQLTALQVLAFKFKNTASFNSTYAYSVRIIAIEGGSKIKDETKDGFPTEIAPQGDFEYTHNIQTTFNLSPPVTPTVSEAELIQLGSNLLIGAPEWKICLKVHYKRGGTILRSSGHRFVYLIYKPGQGLHAMTHGELAQVKALLPGDFLA